MEVIEEVDEVIGFRKGKNEIVAGEKRTESDRKPLAIALLITGSLSIAINLWALTQPALVWLATIPAMGFIGVLLIVVGIYVWIFYRRTFRIIVTSTRIVEEFFSKRFKLGIVRDHHYRFFESIDVIGNTKNDTALLHVHLCSGEELEYVLPKNLITAVIDHSRMFVGIQ